MKVYVGMGVTKTTSEKDSKEIKKLKTKIAELENENTNLITEIETLNSKIAELEKITKK